ncbi:MAG: SH3 domain-containing protein [Caldilineaceae bacterium]
MNLLGQLRSTSLLIWLTALLLTLSGCGFSFGVFGPETTPTPTPDSRRASVPTFTPTPVVPPTAVPTAAPPEPTATPMPVEPSPTPTADTPPTPTPAPAAKLTVNAGVGVVNVRNGPGTNYGIAGTADAGQAFDLIGKNPEGDWWQICCVNGQESWIYGQLASVENAEAVAVAQNIPAPPPVAVAPTAAPAPAAAPTDPPPPPAADPCANIGGDGCKFKVRDGPKFGQNGGTELKLQLFFIHSGIDGGQPQGSYFVVLIKDGQNLGVSDGVRSIANASNQGSLGPYNYEYKIGLDKLPGNTVAGNYVMFVLDGNGERDSHDISFTVPEGQGEVWVKWDQG